ncbi:dephospho-CoA kinase [Treponema parvum]|uniref:Dephospho-CoA kinase n=1 Tax=Treponema parvum TaxID=138851 RepID=A0A975F0M8_9SPIR|nr:dephospho-CoA kinase [Treponema parvum]QTQ12218.1 dephospho-CoA kinase [Treponema parvum]
MKLKTPEKAPDKNKDPPLKTSTPASMPQPAADRMILCLTGPMAAGKNAASKIFEKYGFECVDFDTLVHKAIEERSERIFEEFSNDAKNYGINLKNGDGSLNRRALGSLIFKDKKFLTRQEAIVYPAVTHSAKDFIKKNPQKNIVFNATVLFKIPELMAECTHTVFIKANVLIRFLRVKKRDTMPYNQILARFYSQKDLFKNYKNSRIPVITIRNSGSVLSLEKRIKKAFKKTFIEHFGNL